MPITRVAAAALSPLSSALQNNPKKPLRPIEPDEGGDYDSPALLSLREIWDAYLEGEADDGDVMGVIHQIGASLELHLDVLQEQVNSGKSDVYDPVFGTICRAFMSHLEALKHMAKEFAADKDEEQSYFEEGYEMAQEATNQMMAAHDGGMQRIAAKAPQFGNIPVLSGQDMKEPLWKQELVADDKTGNPQLKSFLVLKSTLQAFGRSDASLESIQELITKTKTGIQAQARENISMMARQGSRSPKERALRQAFADSGLAITFVVASLDRLYITVAGPNPSSVEMSLAQLESACAKVAVCYRRIFESTRS